MENYGVNEIAVWNVQVSVFENSSKFDLITLGEKGLAHCGSAIDIDEVQLRTYIHGVLLHIWKKWAMKIDA